MSNSITIAAAIILAGALGTRPAAQPQVEYTRSAINNEIVFSVRGLAIPATKRLTLEFSYDRTATTASNALVSSPLPAVAVAALLDTAQAILTVMILPASALAITDSKEITRIRFPGEPAAENTITFREAKYADSFGKMHSLEISPLSISRRPFSPGTRDAFRPAKSGLIFLANGRVVAGPTALRIDTWQFSIHDELRAVIRK